MGEGCGVSDRGSTGKPSQPLLEKAIFAEQESQAIRLWEDSISPRMMGTCPNHVS